MSGRDVTRHGLTLLEVVLALAILAGSFAMLGQLVGIGVRAARNGQDLTRAHLLAESVMSEIAAGIVPAEAITGVAVDTDPGWTVSAEVLPTMYDGILQITVMTRRDNDTRGRSEYYLTRWLRDPSLAIPEDDAATTSGGSSGSTGTTTGNQNQNEADPDTNDEQEAAALNSSRIQASGPAGTPPPATRGRP